jgi:hypothetical protein
MLTARAGICAYCKLSPCRDVVHAVSIAQPVPHVAAASLHTDSFEHLALRGQGQEHTRHGPRADNPLLVA